MRFELSIERWRGISYVFWWFFVLFSFAISKLFVADILAAGPPEGTPVEQLGCGPFNRQYDLGNTNLEWIKLGDGFDFDTQSHLFDKFGYANICAYWDYEPARGWSAMVYPMLEYAFLLHLVLDLLGAKILYDNNRVARWYYILSCIIFPVNVVLLSLFRLIFVYVAYDNLEMHTFGFLCLQIGLSLISLQNELFTVQRGLPGGLNTKIARIFTQVLFVVTFASNVLKIYGTVNIVINGGFPEFYLTPIAGKTVGKMIDYVWMFCNGFWPPVGAFLYACHEKPLVFDVNFRQEVQDRGPAAENDPLIDDQGKQNYGANGNVNDPNLTAPWFSF